MSAGGRKYEHVEPRNIAGSDLPDWMRHDPNHNAIVGLGYCVAALALIALVAWLVWLL